MTNRTRSGIVLLLLAHGLAGCDRSSPTGPSQQPGGYTARQSFDFNGDWQGHTASDQNLDVRFTIRNNVLASFTCGASSTFTFSPPPPVTGGAFATSGNDGVGVSGRIVSASQAVGTISIEPCTATNWVATRR